MNPETKKILTTVIRKVLLCGLVLLVIWLVLMILRSNIPEDIIAMLNERSGGQEDIPKVSLNSADWDWDTSLWTGESVSERTESLGDTLTFLVVNGLISLGIAALLLYLGVLIAKVTSYPPWIARLRSIFRLVIVSGGVSAFPYSPSALLYPCVF